MVYLLALMVSISFLAEVSIAKPNANSNAKAKTKTTTTTTKSEKVRESSLNLEPDSPISQTYFSDFQYELQTSFSGGGLKSFKSGGETMTEIDIQASVSKLIKNNIQVGGEVRLYNRSGGGSSSFLEVLGFGVYNIDSNLKQSLYAKGGLGLLNTVNDQGKNETKLGVMIGGGKRFPIMDKVTYTPEGRLYLVNGDTVFQIMALNFSLLY